MDVQGYMASARNAAMYAAVQMAWEGWQNGPAHVATMALAAVGTKRAIEAEEGWVRATRARRAELVEKVNVTKQWKYKKARLLF